MYATITFKNEETGIFKKFIPQRYSGKVTIFNMFSKKGIIQYYLSKRHKIFVSITKNKEAINHSKVKNKYN